MAFENFPATLLFKVIETSEVILAGGFTVAEVQQLKHAVVTLYKQGAHAATERLRVKLYHDAAKTKLYATSDWAYIADIENVSTNWLGRVRIDFPDSSLPWVGPLSTFYLAVEAGNYTRNGTTHYLALSFDWPYPVNSNIAALQVALYGYRRIRN